MTSTVTTSQPVQPRWREIFEQLRAELPLRAYGSRFYSIVEICEKFSVSTITARRVLTELQSEGLVEKIRSRGTIVRQLPQATSIRLIMHAGIRPDYAMVSVVMRRQLAGIAEIAQQKQVDFDTLSESHLQMAFPERRENFGFFLTQGVSPKTIDFLRSRNMPFVFLNPIDGWKGLPHVRPDRVRAGELAAEYLLSLGHKRIGYILGPIVQRNFRDRLKGYRAALEHAGVRFDWNLVRQSDGMDPQQDEQALSDLLALRSPPTAIIAGDDNRAIAVLASCKRRGIKVPEQMSVLGYPNYPETKLMNPPLSVLDACYEQVGAAAVRLLLEQMLEDRDRVRQSMVIEPRLVVRGSTAPAPRRGESQA